MIVDPDFLTHWKTQMLITELSDKSAPVYVLALWAHCQQRRTDTFTNLAPHVLKGICRYEGDANKLRAAFECSGFLDVDGAVVVVHGWAERNVKLLANWANGEKGGRPPKGGKPKQNPTETQSPIGVTQQEPRRGEKRGQDPEPPNPQPAAGGGVAGGLSSDDVWKRICACVGRPPEKQMSALEMQALHALASVTDAEMRLVERYVELCRTDPKKHTKPKALAHTLLTEFWSEVGKARLALGKADPLKKPPGQLPDDWSAFAEALPKLYCAMDKELLATITTAKSWDDLQASKISVRSTYDEWRNAR